MFFVGKRDVVQFGDPALFDHASESFPVAGRLETDTVGFGGGEDICHEIFLSFNCPSRRARLGAAGRPAD